MSEKSRDEVIIIIFIVPRGGGGGGGGGGRGAENVSLVSFQNMPLSLKVLLDMHEIFAMHITMVTICKRMTLANKHKFRV